MQEHQTADGDKDKSVERRQHKGGLPNQLIQPRTDDQRHNADDQQVDIEIFPVHRPIRLIG